ncbi:hypothetical protein NCS52_01289900 [Fusarium sp. LHS14.1]|nr:hypothetical protein NCS52_01289900 [Fusarium sp. LHS14.1]
MAEPQPVGLYQKAHDIFRGTYVQAVLLGLISFTQPGIWNAMNSLGAGGQAEPYVVNAANVITFVVMFVLSPLASIVGNIVGLRWLVVFGTIGYVPYSAALYVNSTNGTQWFLIFGAVTCGLSATALWTGEAAMAVGYPEIRRRGICIGIWLALGKLGSIIASAIQLALNKDSSAKGAISTKTYLVLIAIQCLGLPLALLLAPAHKLVRSDGKKPTFGSTNRTFKTQVRGYLTQFRRREVLLLIPAFITAQWGVTYQGNYLAAYFTVRAHTKHLKWSTQARSMWYFLLALFTLVWIWNLVIQTRWAKESPGDIDWSSRNFRVGVAIFILYRIAYETVGIWLYWGLGTFDTDLDAITLSMAVLRGGESLGSALAYAVGSVRSASLMANLIVATVVFYAAVPFTTWAAHLIKDRDVVEGDVGSENEEASRSQGTEYQAVERVITRIHRPLRKASMRTSKLIYQHRSFHERKADLVTLGATGSLETRKLDVITGDPHEAYVIVDRNAGFAIKSAIIGQTKSSLAKEPEKVPLVFHHESRHFAHHTAPYPRIILEHDLPHQNPGATSPATLWLWGATHSITLDGTSDAKFEEACRESHERLEGAAELLKHK